jgi:hypothetical protein
MCIVFHKEGVMIRQKKNGRILRVAMLISIFGVGFLCGSLSQQRAYAQLKELGDAAMKQAAGSEGALGSVAEMGTSIMEMQEHVTGLQKNLDTFKKVQSTLGGK